MAGTTTISSKEYSTGIKVITCSFTADDSDGSFVSAVLGAERGKELLQVHTLYGATAPTDNSDLAITDSVTSRDLVATNGPNSVDNAANNVVAPESSPYVVGNLTVAITNNSVNSAVTTVILIFKVEQ